MGDSWLFSQESCGLQCQAVSPEPHRSSAGVVVFLGGFWEVRTREAAAVALSIEARKDERVDPPASLHGGPCCIMALIEMAHLCCHTAVSCFSGRGKDTWHSSRGAACQTRCGPWILEG